MVHVIEVPATTPVLRDTFPAPPAADPGVLQYTPATTPTSQATVLSVVMPGVGRGGPGSVFTTRTVTADTTAVVGELLQVDASAGAVSVTPPTSFAAGDGFTLVKVDDSTNSVIFAAPVAADDEGAEIVAGNAAATFVWDGTIWVIVSVNTSYSGDAAILEAVPEIARDALGTALVAGSNVTITPNDGADTITISASVPTVTGFATQSALDAAVAAIPETARDTLGAALTAGAGISLAVDDTNNQIIVTATAGSGTGGVTTEDVQDVVNALLAAGTHSGVSFVYNDAANTLSATVANQTWSQITGKPTFATVATSGLYADLTGKPTVPSSKADLGLGNVDNTSDANKPVSTATQTALNGKAAAAHTHNTSDLTATGTRNNTTFLRGDGQWATPAFANAGPYGGVQVAGYSTTVTPNATNGVHFRYYAQGSMTVNPPTGAIDGQRILLEIQAYGAARTITFASSIELSAAAPARSVTIPSGTWGYFALLNRDSTYRLMAMDPLPAS